MKHFIPIFLFLLLLAGCGDKATSSSSQKDLSSNSGLVISQPEDVPDAPDVPDEDPDTSSGDFHTEAEDEGTLAAENIPDTEGEGTEPMENIDYSKMKQFITPLTDAGGAEIGVLSFAIQFPEGWAALDNLVYDTEGRQIAEILPSIEFEDEGILDKLAEQYPDSDPISVTVAGFSGVCFIHQTPLNDPAFAGSFKNEVFYYLEVEDWLICMKFIPAPGVGIGTQREAFQADIKAII